MSFKFKDDEKNFNLSYYIFIPNNINNLDKKKFDEFYKNEIKKYDKEIYKPNIFEMIQNYHKSKGVIQQEQKSKINYVEWDFKTPEEYLFEKFNLSLHKYINFRIF